MDVPLTRAPRAMPTGGGDGSVGSAALALCVGRAAHTEAPLATAAEQGAHIEAEEARLTCARGVLCVGSAQGSSRAGVQGGGGRAKTMTGTVAWVLWGGLPGVVFLLGP
jgi:hypothetical protein